MIPAKSVYTWSFTWTTYNPAPTRPGIPPLFVTRPEPIPEPERPVATATEILDVLALAAAILEAGSCTERWACSLAARRDDGMTFIAVNDPKATHFCLEGAILRAGWELDLLNETDVTIKFSSIDWITLKPLAKLIEADLRDRPKDENPFTTDMAGWWDYHGDKRRALALFSRVAHELSGK